MIKIFIHLKIELLIGLVIPNESEDLINSVKLKWVARNIGFEKIVLKNKKMICYFMQIKIMNILNLIFLSHF